MMLNSKNEEILIESVSLAEEILNSGSGEGRGVRLAALVLKLNESMMAGDIPVSWIPPMPIGEISRIVFPKPAPVPRVDAPTVRPKKRTSSVPPLSSNFPRALRLSRSNALFSDDDIDYLDNQWDKIHSVPPTEVSDNEIEENY